MITRVIEQLCAGQRLSQAQSFEIFDQLIAGQLDPLQISGLLVALKANGESPEEISGAAKALRLGAAPFDAEGLEVADTCGTGGDGAHTVNISTAVAFVCAALGLSMVKHGNRSVSSSCGSADVLEACGVELMASAQASRRSLELAKVCFLFAPRYHQGVRFAMPARKALGTRTIFNLLGPLINPANPQYQVMGVYDPALCEPLAKTLGLLGVKAALVVHGSGLDELALHGPTFAALYQEGQVQTLELVPELAGLQRAPLEALRGHGPKQNAAWLRGALAGQAPQAHLDAIALNAAALLWISGRADGLADGAQQALDCLAQAKPLEHLEQLVELSHGA